jgi:hypothetical protein
LLQKPGLIKDQDRSIIRQMLGNIISNNVAQRIGVPVSSTKNGLLAPGTRIARRVRPHPTRLAPLISKQAIQEQASVYGHSLLREQPSHPSFDVV